MPAQIIIDRMQLAHLCQRYHIARLSVFGSVLRDDFTPDSDVDVLIEFEPGHTPGLAYFELGQKLSEILGRPVDYAQPDELHQRIKERVLSEAEVVYEAR